MTIGVLLLVLALICFVLGAFGVAVRNVNLVSLGLAFLTAAMLFGAGVLHG